MAVPATPSTVPPTATASNQLYLQFWFSSTVGFNNIHAAVTNIPIPYGISNGWPSAEKLEKSCDRGRYDTRLDALITSPSPLPTTITRLIRFKETFSSIPKVMVWLTGLSATSGAAICVKATANDVTETEFALQITSREGAPLVSAGAAWAAWPEANVWSQPAVTVGSFSTVKPGGAKVSTLQAVGTTEGHMIGGPNVFLAVCTVDMVLEGSVWMDLSIKQEQHGHRRVSWGMKAGPVEAKFYSARVGYVIQ